MRWFRYAACLGLLVSLFFLPKANNDYLFLQAVRQMAEDALQGLPPEIEGFSLEYMDAEDDAERELRRLVVKEMDLAFKGSDGVTWRFIDGQLRPGVAAGALLPMRVSAQKMSDHGTLTLEIPGLGVHEERTQPFFKWYALLPPFLAILLALLFQRTLLALFAGVWLGATLMADMNPLAGLWSFAHTYFYEGALRDEFRMDIIGFVVALCAMVGVLTRGGGIQGFVNKIMGFAKTVRSTQFVTYLMGLAIFFDDYANCIIVGNTARPLTDKLKISREKLSYLVDSTAAPVAGLSMLSTWIAYEVSTFSAQLPEAGITEGAYEIFFRTLPYRFYCILTLIFIALTIFMQRDFGPMLRAERRARKTGEVLRPGGKPMVSASLTKIKAKEGVPARWYNAVLPIAVILVVTIEELWRIGGGWERPLLDLFSGPAIREVLGNASDANSAWPVFMGASAGFALAVVLMLTQRILAVGECASAAWSSTKALSFAIAILFLAWCIGGVCEDIGTAHYLIALFKGVIDPILFPTILFLTSCIVAFATGSSWSTMAILLPNTVIFAVKMGEVSDIGPMAMLVISIGAVLEGSIFGDHCSPISDTTILSSVSSAADHMDHIKTQAPYAMVTMACAIFAGYIPAVMGLHPALSLLIGVSVLVAVLWLMGRDAGAAVNEDEEG